jgi:predicted HTH transcriptional regulator
MKEKHKQILTLCAEQPMTTRKLVQATGDSPAAIRSRLHELVKIEALKTKKLDDQYGTMTYSTVQDWRPRHNTSLTAYEPLGICVLGVWM